MAEQSIGSLRLCSIDRLGGAIAPPVKEPGGGACPGSVIDGLALLTGASGTQPAGEGPCSTGSNFGASSTG